MAAAKKQQNPEIAEALSSWTALNDFLREADEQEALAALEHERANGKRLQYLMRCHARYNKVRAERERAELLAPARG